MARKVCDYCGTEYDPTKQRCPLCGSAGADDSDLYIEPEEEVPAAPRRRPDTNGAAPRRRAYVQPEEDDEDEDDEKPARTRRRGGAHEAQSDTIPKWISVLICVFLSLAVLIGAIFALYSLGILTPKEKDKKEDPSLVLPIQPADPEPGESDMDDSAVCTGITLDQTQTGLDARNKLVTLRATVRPVGCTQSVVWTSADESVCTVNQSGAVTAVGEGESVITAACGDFTATCVVRNVFGESAGTEQPPEEETPAGNGKLSSEDFTLFKAGETAKLTVQGAPSGAQVSWSVADESVATVSDNGTVTARKGGTTTVTASVGGQTLKCIVRCNIQGAADADDSNAEVVGTASLSHSDVTLGQGETFKLAVTGSSSTHNWSVSDGSVCSVDADGKVTGLGAGTASVSTTVGGQTLKCIVRVK